MSRILPFAAIVLLLALPPDEARAELTCMVCQEVMVNGVLHHGFWSGSEWLCREGGGGSETLMGEGGCRACGGESECHIIEEPDPENPLGGLQPGPCHVQCSEGPPDNLAAAIDAWLELPTTQGHGTRHLVLLEGDPVRYDPQTNTLRLSSCDGTMVRQWVVPPTRRDLIITHAI